MRNREDTLKTIILKNTFILQCKHLQSQAPNLATIKHPIILLTRLNTRVYCAYMGGFYFLMVVLAVYFYLDARDERNKKLKAKRRRTISANRPFTASARGVFDVFRKRRLIIAFIKNTGRRFYKPKLVTFEIPYFSIG